MEPKKAGASLKEVKPWIRSLVRRVNPTRDWSDLVLSKETELLLNLIEAEIRNAEILESWGFERRGLTVIFTGPPGTAKTPAAEALAGSLGKKLLLVMADKVQTGIITLQRKLSGDYSMKSRGRKRWSSLILSTNHSQLLDPALERRIALEVPSGFRS